MSCCAFDCACFTLDKEKQVLGLICCNKQTGCCPFKFCVHDNDGMCWGCVCCGCQIDPCWGPRQLTNCCCMLNPFKCCDDHCRVWCLKLFCCNPDHGKNDIDKFKKKKFFCF